MTYSIIGSGFIFPRHIQSIAETGGEIIDIVNEKSLISWREMVGRTSADCIVILTPNYLHYDMIKESLRCGKTVLCEKPMTLSSRETKEFIGQSVYTVLQLRHHPVIKDIEAKDKNIVEMDIAVYRDEKYHLGWKGQDEKSGGLLFNLGIHYFDLLIHLFGEPTTITSNIEKKRAGGTLIGVIYFWSWRIIIDASPREQHRIFKINGKDYNFSSKDNLSYENLHKFVYRDLLSGKGVLPEDAMRSICLVEKLYEQNLETGT